jgi:hypothetical protein
MNDAGVKGGLPQVVAPAWGPREQIPVGGKRSDVAPGHSSP